MIIEVDTLTATEAKKIQWILKALYKSDPSDRPVLQHVQVKGGILAASDGHRVHGWVTPVWSALREQVPDGLYKIELVKHTAFFKPAVDASLQFPDLDAVCRNTGPIESSRRKHTEMVLTYVNLTVIFSANPKYLIDALSGMDNGYALVQIGSMIRVAERNTPEADSGHAFAILMPMHVSGLEGGSLAVHYQDPIPFSDVNPFYPVPIPAPAEQEEAIPE